MKTVATLLAALLIGSSAHAGCADAASAVAAQTHSHSAARQVLGGVAMGDSSRAAGFWTGAAVAGGVGVLTLSPATGFWSGVAAGAVRELVSGNRGRCATRNFLASAAGAAIGATGAHLIVSPQFIGYRREF